MKKLITIIAIIAITGCSTPMYVCTHIQKVEAKKGYSLYLFQPDNKAAEKTIDDPKLGAYVVDRSGKFRINQKINLNE